jgi:hypothetical protein
MQTEALRMPHGHQKKQTIQKDLSQNVIGIDSFFGSKMRRRSQEILNKMLKTKQVIVVFPKIKRVLQRLLHLNPRSWMFREILDTFMTKLLVIVFLDSESILTKKNQHQAQREKIIS